MLAWLTRLFGGHPTAASAAAPAAAPTVAPAATSSGPAGATAAATAAGAATAAAIAGAPPQVLHPGQQLPLLGRDGQVAGFELRLAAGLQRRLAARDAGDDAALTAHWAALLAAARALQQGGRDVLLQMPASVLQRPALVDQVPAGLWLLPLAPASAAWSATAAAATAATASTTATTTASLRRRGVRLGVPDGPPAQAGDADFVLLQASAGGSDTLLLSAQRWQEARPRLPWLALGLDSVDDVERALAAGAALAGGRLQGAARTAAARPLQAAAHRICAMLNDLTLERDTAVVGAAVRADVALSYRLLRYANSPALGQARSVETVEQAVLLLGRAELTRWLSVLLLAAAGGRQASAALQEHALARGRLLELLATQRGDAAPQLLFTTGLLSRLDLLLEMPLAAALQPLRLSDGVAQALLHGSGPLAPYLALADALEGDDEPLVQSLSAPFGGLDAVLAQAGLAWAWAAQVQRG